MLVNNGKYVIIFNGPPGSGKDHAADLVTNMFDRSKHLRFKDHLFKCVTTLFNVTDEEFFEKYNDREQKEKSTCLLEGYSPREAMIFVSETVIKPKFGHDYFGHIAADNLIYGINAFSDGGFTEELEPVYNECDGNMIIVQLHCPWSNFDNDSRTYIDEFKDVPILKLINDSTIEIFEIKVMNILQAFLDGDYHNE